MPINAVNLTGNVYPAGPKGDTGPANTLEIGTVEKGENASASITGEAPNQTLNLILPKGDKGEKGDTGETNSLSIGTVEKGTVPSATITGQAPNQILNLVLPKGDTGEKGEVGPRGEQGIQGNPGPINSIKIGRVEKGEEASVTIVGESPNQILNFVLPIGPKGNTGEKGDQGPKGEQGIQGETGATTSLSIGRVSSGEEASATIIGEAPDQILNLVLPKGDKGEKGNVGPQGEQGIQGNPGPANSLTIGTVEKGAVPSATITGNSPNQVLNLVLPTGETDEIEAIKKENSLLKSQIPTGTASGNNIHLGDSSNMNFEWKLRCGSRQATRSGKNVFDNTVEPQFISNAKKEIINTGERIILTAKTFSYAIFKVEKNIREYAGKTVRLKMDFSKSNANLNPKYGVLLGSSDYSNREVKGESTVSGYTITFNLPSELENEKEYLFVRLYATQNNEGNIENYVDYTNIILTIDNENMSYEAFGVSPSPKFPSKIENVENDVKMTVYNKNLFDGNFTTNGIWNDDGSINYVIQSKLYWRTDFIKIPNTKIYFSDKMISSFSSAILLEFDAKRQFIALNKIYQVNSNLNKISLNSNTKYIAIQWNLQQGNEITNIFTKLQIEENTAATDYIQHEEQSIIFPLVEGQKLYEGSYLAKEGIHNKRKQVILNGKEEWNLGGRQFDKCMTFYIYRKDGNTSGTKICNLFKFDDMAYIDKKDIECVTNNVLNGTPLIIIQIEKSRLKTENVAGFQEYLSGQYNAGKPMVVEYELATEEIIPYTPEQQAVIDKILYTYKNVTNISVDDELATLDITYKKDIETMFNNQAKEYNERLSNIESLLNTTSTSALLLDNLESDLEKEV